MIIPVVWDNDHAEGYDGYGFIFLVHYAPSINTSRALIPNLYPQNRLHIFGV